MRISSFFKCGYRTTQERDRGPTVQPNTPPIGGAHANFAGRRSLENNQRPRNDVISTLGSDSAVVPSASSRTQELAQTQAQLAQTQAQLAQTQAQLAQTQAQLAQTQAQLAQTQAQLAQTQAQLVQVQRMAQDQSHLGTEALRRAQASSAHALAEAERGADEFMLRVIPLVHPLYLQKKVLGDPRTRGTILSHPSERQVPLLEAVWDSLPQLAGLPETEQVAGLVKQAINDLPAGVGAALKSKVNSRAESSSATSTKATIGFFALPAEVRQQVYPWLDNKGLAAMSQASQAAYLDTRDQTERHRALKLWDDAKDYSARQDMLPVFRARVATLRWPLQADVLLQCASRVSDDTLDAFLGAPEAAGTVKALPSHLQPKVLARLCLNHDIAYHGRDPVVEASRLLADRDADQFLRLVIPNVHALHLEARVLGGVGKPGTILSLTPERQAPLLETVWDSLRKQEPLMPGRDRLFAVVAVAVNALPPGVGEEVKAKVNGWAAA